MCEVINYCRQNWGVKTSKLIELVSLTHGLARVEAFIICHIMYIMPDHHVIVNDVNDNHVVSTRADHTLFQ